MPKVNPTMLDKLVDVFKSGSQRKPEIIQATTIRDPLGYSMVQRRFGTATGKLPSMKSERETYQEGIDARLFPKMRKADELVSERYDDIDTFKNEWNEAAEEAKEYMKDDWETGLDDQTFDDVDPYNLEVDAPSTDLRDYWPDYRRTPQEIYDDYDVAQDAYYAAKDEQRMLRSPQTRMMEQTQTPRYRRYQDAMQRRDINRRAGRVNAAIMNLARQGYSLPEIREILRRQGR
jgi:hypothetical protein